MNAKECEAYDRGYTQGIIQGRVDARIMKENADACSDCAFEHVEDWELPCAKCMRNCKDYWRAKTVME